MQKHFGWSTRVRESVDWEAFRRCRAKLQHRPRQFTKFVFDLLPTAVIVARSNPSQSAMCPRCGDHPETNDHLYQCSVAAVRSWRSTTLADLRALLESRSTDYSLVELLMAGLTAVFDLTVPDTLELGEFPESLHPLIESQNAIGWRQLLRGRASILWGQHQQQQYEGRSLSDHTVTGVTWVTAVLSFLLLQILELWNQRNAAIFDPSSEEAPDYRREKVLQELRLIHSLRSQYRAGDTQFLFTHDPDDEEETFRHYIDRDGLYRTEVWISNWTSFFKKSLKKAKLRP
eukprot:scaffold12703_cov73-Cylindrotheca_fusiformis.AAC.1